MPTTLTSESNAGCSIDVPTSACAARWKTTSASVSKGCANIVLEERGSPVDVVAAPRREVVEHDDLVAARQQRVDEVRADEPCPTGNERAHPGSLDGLV